MSYKEDFVNLNQRKQIPIIMYVKDMRERISLAVDELVAFANPALFTEIEVVHYKGKDVLAIKFERDGITYAVLDGRYLKRLGKNCKPYYPDEMSNKCKSGTRC